MINLNPPKETNEIRVRISRNSRIGMFASAVLIVALWGRTFFLARGLSVEDFGWVIICLNFFSVFNLLVRPGIPETLLRFFHDFEKSNSKDERSSLIFFSFYVPLISALCIIVTTFVLADYVSERYYENLSLAVQLKALCTVLSLVTLRETFTTLLRLHDMFFAALLPGVAGVVFAALRIGIDTGRGELSFSTAIGHIIGGEVLALLILGFFAFRVRKLMSLSFTLKNLLLRPLSPHFSRIKSSLLQTSLLGILRSGSEVGGVFLLGLLGTAQQTAILGIALQLTRPFSMIQATLGNAIQPEIARLHSEQNYRGILKIINKVAQSGLLFCVVGLFGSWLFLPSLLEYLKPDYLQALPVFYILLFTQFTMLITMPLFPLAIIMNDLTRRNMTVAVRFLYLGLAVLLGLNAVSVAIVQLAGSLTIRIFNDLPLYLRIKSTIQKK